MKARLLIHTVLVFISFGLSYSFVSWCERGTPRSYTFFREGNYLKHATKALPHLLDEEDYSRLPTGDTLVNLLPNDLQEILGNFLYRNEGNIDSWGNPYHIVVTEQEGKPWIGLYSTGADGVSSSNGNDLDDLNSWGKDGFDYYPGVIRASIQAASNRDVLIYGSVFAISLMCMYELIYVCVIKD